jgi:hypothetical protein
VTTIDERVEAALSELERERDADPQFLRVRDLIRDMRERGLLRKREYDIPLIDTIGRTAFRTGDR